MVRSCAPLEAGPSALENIYVRGLDGDDGIMLGELLYVAYKGTIDDEGQSLEEAHSEAIETLQGRYGHIIWPASFIATEATDAEIAVSCCVVTDSEKFGPLLAFVATHPDFQKRGLARTLIAKSIDALRDVDVHLVKLVVTNGNESAMSLYRKLGFRDS
ncbi:MAG TPA: GNAT family N-acetyltransferase [Drouetiella sp.]